MLAALSEGGSGQLVVCEAQRRTQIDVQVTVWRLETVQSLSILLLVLGWVKHASACAWHSYNTSRPSRVVLMRAVGA